MKLTIKNKLLRSIETCCASMAGEFFQEKIIKPQLDFKRGNKFEGRLLIFHKNEVITIIEYCHHCGTKIEWVVIDDFQAFKDAEKAKASQKKTKKS